ncbi:VanW family protein [Krasilnikoviella flava]|uniref:Putative peptidoglycan binding domain-containing protein n=1 Tax=Krasilnikoviella flava TaxID=526729 RepID=A0A1T5JLY8_9MICO|nr:VanW family protein [Krasilnikoviella flava]SKC52429.1 Putative peptidoglycan binding domain-containing protein [Krasilnikoviella flava]
MGHPTERDPDPTGSAAEPARPEADATAGPDTAEQVTADATAGASAQQPSAEPADPADEPDVPYEPRVRLYEQRVIATVPAPSSGPATQALPAVVASAPNGAPFGAPGEAPLVDPVVPPPAEPGSPLDGLAGDGAPSRAPKVALWAGVGLVVVAGLYAGAQWAVAGTVPKGTSVAGVEIGGMDAGPAVAALDDGLGPRATEPVAVQAGEASSTIDPAEAGLSFDAQATVDGLTGFSLNPAHLWEHLVGGDEVPPVVDVSRPTLTEAVSGLEESLQVEPVDGTVGFKGGKAVATEAVEGSSVLVDDAVDTVAAAWLVTTGPVDLPTEVVEPAVTQAETDAALEQAEQVVSAPVTVDVGEQSAELTPRALAKATSFKNADGELKVRFDGEKLVSDVVDDTDDLLTEPDDAHFVFSGGKPVVEGGEQGTTLDPDDTAAAVGDAALSADDRSTELKLVEREPERTKEALEDMGVKEVVSEFSTPLTSEPIRTRNLERGAQLVTGTLVAPGETFSLLDTLSPIDESNGFVAAGVVSNGVHTDAVGGGLSQMATTTYNAGYFAGFDDAGHQPHSYWFDRYPAGREATIYVGAIDMKFTNDTPYGAVLQSWVSGGRLHVQVWSTDYYDVETRAGDKQNVVPATAVHKTGGDCVAYPGGSDGFTITNYRQVSHDGKQVKDESKTWTYKPDNPVVCDQPKADRDDERQPKDAGDDDAGDDGKAKED